jgi:hypothetical protein
MMSESVFLAALAAVGQQISSLRFEAENLAMPPAVINGLAWLRDDAAEILGDAAQAVANSKENEP